MNRYTKMFLLLLSFLTIFTSVASAVNTIQIASQLESFSVTVKTEEGIGSGTVITRCIGSNEVSFVWTAAHVIVHTVEQTNLNFGPFIFQIQQPKNTNPPVLVKQIFVCQPVVKDGKYLRMNQWPAKVLEYNREQDLALLMVIGHPFTNGASVMTESIIPAIGTEVFTVASPLKNFSSFSSGYISFVGRISDGHVFDQTTLVVYPGSSGSGVFLADGKLIGIMTIMIAPNINLMVPVRRIDEWARTKNITWALDSKLPVPSYSQLQSQIKN